MRECGNDGCGRPATFTVVVDLGKRRQLLFSCGGCRRYLGPEELPLTVRSEEVVGADEDWILAASVIEEYEMPGRWTPGLRSYVSPLLRKE